MLFCFRISVESVLVSKWSQVMCIILQRVHVCRFHIMKRYRKIRTAVRALEKEKNDSFLTNLGQCKRVIMQKLYFNVHKSYRNLCFKHILTIVGILLIFTITLILTFSWSMKYCSIMMFFTV